MKNKVQWETKSLEWIHEVREEMDREIRQSGMSMAQWLRKRGRVDVEALCNKLGLKNVQIHNQDTRIFKK